MAEINWKVQNLCVEVKTGIVHATPGGMPLPPGFVEVTQTQADALAAGKPLSEALRLGAVEMAEDAAKAAAEVEAKAADTKKADKPKKAQAKKQDKEYVVAKGD